MFFILSFIFILAAVAITLKTLIGYNSEISLKNKQIISFAVIFSWGCPVLSHFLRRLHMLSTEANLIISQSLYAIFITAFFLLCLLITRDMIWVPGYKIASKLKKVSDAFDPMKLSVIKKANIITVAAAFLLSGYAVYEGVKFPQIKETVILTEKVDAAFKIVALTDMHITPVTPLSRINRIVNTVNELNPDIIVLVGDIIDAKPSLLKTKMRALANLKAKHGVFITLGNHEFYHGSLEWERQFRKTGFSYLANNGLMLPGTNVYLSGLPDPQLLKINDAAMEGIRNTLGKAPQSSFRVFLSHSPRFIERLDNRLIDLQISGHTHGGQIFPFHFAVKRFNGFVAGLYDVNSMKLYISRGVSGWGPPMRLFAPSEISVIELIPEKKN
ncbi:MAG: metallophosphoesterase [Alphaproteobacteria bacterium]